MAKFLLAVAAVVDLALAALLIGVSGFLFGSGPESMHAGVWAAVAYAAAVIACIVAPVAGFTINRRGKTGGQPAGRMDTGVGRNTGPDHPAAVLAVISYIAGNKKPPLLRGLVVSTMADDQRE